MVISRAASVCSDKSGRFKSSQGEIPLILSRHYFPSFGSRELAKPSFPYRAIGTLSSIDVAQKQFGVLVKHEKRDPETLIQLVNDFYTQENEDKEVMEVMEAKTLVTKDDQKGYNFERCKFVGNPQVGEMYAARIEELHQIVRVRVLENSRSSKEISNQIKVHLVDYGMITYINEGKTMKLDQEFTEEDYRTGLSLVCRLPDDRILAGAAFPKLENFKLGDHVEVYVLSDDEPCLAVLGSLASGPNAISRELFSSGMDQHLAECFNRATGILNADVVSYKGWAPSCWTHSDLWTLVTLLSAEDLGHIAVRDVFTSLRFLRLQQSLNRSYKKTDFCQTMKVDVDRLRSGDPVVVYCKPLNSYVRGTVTSLLHNGLGCDVEALDIPNLTVCNAPTSMVYYPSSVLLDVPPLVFYVNLMKSWNCMTRAEISEKLGAYLGPNSVAILKFSSDGTKLETHHQRFKVKDMIQEYLSNLSGDEDSEDDCRSVPHPLSSAVSVADDDEL